MTPVYQDLSAPLPNGWRLFDYQQETVQLCLQHQRTILALDMGLGMCNVFCAMLHSLIMT